MVRRIVSPEDTQKWAQIAGDVRQRIANGGFLKGDIVTITKIEGEYGVSRGTAQRALHGLVKSDVLAACGKRGFVVLLDPGRPGGPDDAGPDGGRNRRPGPPPRRKGEKPAVTPLGQHLRALRKDRGWSPVMLGKKARVSGTTIRMIETDYRGAVGKVSGKTLMQLSRALGLPDDYLADFAENPGDPGQIPQSGTMTASGEFAGQLGGMIGGRFDRIESRLEELDTALERLEAKIDWIGVHFFKPAKDRK